MPGFVGGWPQGGSRGWDRVMGTAVTRPGDGGREDHYPSFTFHSVKWEILKTF